MANAYNSIIEIHSFYFFYAASTLEIVHANFVYMLNNEIKTNDCTKNNIH